MRKLTQFLEQESSTSYILIAATVVAIIWSNSSLAPLHTQLIDAFHLTINDGLMSLFFLLVGLELKRGFLEGELSSFKQIALPGIAALGGMLVPALIYITVNINHPDVIKGWSTPVATDIAFALGALSLLGKRVPRTLKLFLLALAIFDDVGAIIIITIFYSAHLSLFLLSIMVCLLLLLFIVNKYEVVNLYIYLIIGTILWLMMLPSGIHPTLAGVLLALFIPDNYPRKSSALHRLENNLRPWVSFIVLPVFALANAGFSLDNLSIDILSSTVMLGIILGLFLGKPLGILSFSWVIIKLKLARLPKNVTWQSFAGASLICGIGFTMSLFLGTLSFQNGENYLPEVRLGVMLGSLLSAISGVIILSYSLPKQNAS